MGHTHTHDASTQATWEKEKQKRDKGEIWWSNGTFFIAVHLFALIGTTYLSPLAQLDNRTAVLCFISWQLASFGVTIGMLNFIRLHPLAPRYLRWPTHKIGTLTKNAKWALIPGYHRLWSHRAFTATLPLRIVLAWMGSMGFQGSVKWWVLRHRLHHRPIHDPYSASNGLWYSHCGWIFRKPAYPRMKLIERADLEADPVVRFQHRYYVPIALFSGLILPCLIAEWGWNDAIGGLVWGGAVARLLIWHTTFCINSLAHWTGLQPYTEEVTAKGNYLLALLTSGEGNHNFHHAFPKDFRNGPHPADWDPTKWIIWLLHVYTPFVPSIARTPDSAIYTARAKIHMAHADRLYASVPDQDRVKPLEELPIWSTPEVLRRHGQRTETHRRVLLLVEGCIVDVGSYIDEHPGGAQLLLSHAVRPLQEETTSDDESASSASSTALERSPASSGHDSGYFSRVPEEIQLKDATKAFFGGMNNHSGAAKEKMRCLRVARLGKS